MRYTILLSVLLRLARALPNSNKTSCRCFPNEPCWPTRQEWANFNITLNGSLVETIPIGSVCHGSSFNHASCEKLRAFYHDPITQLSTSSSVMAPYWANRSCDAFTEKESRCEKGTYIQYAVRVATTADVVKTIAFAKKQNLRLVVRNTGHDYLGKSTGAGGLGLWMHHLQGLSILDYQSNYYSGKAIKVAAGMLSVDVSAEAHNHGLSVVSGNCPTVGLVGGFTQGGGLGPLTSRYGLGADQMLEWEVVTLDGRILRATPDSNTDLYWALSGGGGGTFGIAVSAIVKAYPEERTASANLTFLSADVSLDAFYEAVEVFHSIIPTLSKAGGVAIYVVQSTAFALIPAILPKSSKKHLDTLLKPILVKLQSLNITYTYTSNDYASYHDAYTSTIPPSETSYFQIGSRVLPPQTLSANYSRITQIIRQINTYGAGIGGLTFHASSSDVNNAVNPRLRTGAVSFTIGTVWSNTDWDLNIANQRLMTEVLVPAIDGLAPGQSTAYLNEADAGEKNWQEVIYGSSYSRLRSIKASYDPEHWLWARTAVGSEAWFERPDGRLCRRGESF